MKRLLVFAIGVLFATAGTASAEFRRIELAIYGMD